MKKIIMLITAIMMMATVMTGCGVNPPAEDVFKKDETSTETDKKDEAVEDKKDAETDTDKKSDADKSDKESNADKSDKESDDKKSEDKTEAADKSDDKNSNDSTPSNDNDNSQSGNSNTGGSTNTGTGNKPVDTPTEPQKPAHTHSYSATVTANASCTANGVKTYTCSCGDSYTESIPATGHNWVDKVNSWTEQVWVDGTPGTISCQCSCGQVFSYDGWQSHRTQAILNHDSGHAGFSEVELGGTEGHYESVPHNDHYNQCANCGATQ